MKIIGHRGARGLAPENTIAALKKALEVGVDEVELDVRVTSDKKAILHHDPELNDSRGNLYPIRSHTYAELRAVKPDLALLVDAIKAIDKKVPIMVEVKPKVDVGPVVTVLRECMRRGWQPKDFSVGSFSQKTLRQLHTALPELPTIVIAHFSGVYAAWRARQVNAHFISMDQKFIWPGFILAMRRSKYKLHAYTLNDPIKARRWQKYGLYAVITDRPDLFKKD